jgi:hypothetical protein
MPVVLFFMGGGHFWSLLYLRLPTCPPDRTLHVIGFIRKDKSDVSKRFNLWIDQPVEIRRIVQFKGNRHLVGARRAADRAPVVGVAADPKIQVVGLLK